MDMTRTKKASRTSSVAGQLHSVLRPDERWGVIGNESVIERLQRQVRQGLESHAYLFTGPRGIGKTTVCRSFAAALLCSAQRDGMACGDCASCASLSRNQHPDVHAILGGTSMSIGIDDIRTLRLALTERPMIASRHVVIIDRADALTEEAANALLKTLEEPAGTTVLLLTVPSQARLPSTVVSRCSVYTLTTVATERLRDWLMARGVKKQIATELALFTDGRPAYALFLSEQPAVYEEVLGDARQLIDILESPLHERIAATNVLAERFDEPALREHLLERWESIGRRLLRSVAGMPDHGPLHERLRRLAGNMTLKSVYAFLNELKRTRALLSGTGSPRLAFESLVLHLPRITS